MDSMVLKTFRVLPLSDLPEWQTKLKESEETWPEFLPGTRWPRVLGGFAARGNPSSFHNNEVRELCKMVYKVIVPELSRLFPGRKIEMLKDRYLLRVPGQVPMAEQWHKDHPIKRFENDIFFGGWLNLDCTDQIFLCAPQANVRKGNNGFAKFEPSEIEQCENAKENFRVPPGHVLLFSENIPHCITATKSSSPIMKLYYGWRITDSDDPHQGLEWMDSFGVPKLPSGQDVRMYSKNHGSAFQVRPFRPWGPKTTICDGGLVQWSMETIIPQALIMSASGVTICPAVLPSLRELGFSDRWPVYTDEERKMHSPM